MSDPAGPRGGPRAGPVRQALRGWRSRLWATFALFLGGSVALGLFLTTLAGRWPWYESLAVSMAIALAVPAAAVLMWLAWGRKVRRRAHQWFAESFEVD